MKLGPELVQNPSFSCMEGDINAITGNLVFLFPKNLPSYLSQRSCKDYIFTGVCLKKRGCLVPGGAWSGGSAPGGCLLPGGSAPGGGGG